MPKRPARRGWALRLVKKPFDKLCRLSGRMTEAVFSDPKLYEGIARGRKNG